MIGRQRNLLMTEKKEDLNYVDFIKEMHHVIMGTSKEFYRILRINEKKVIASTSIIDPMKIGIDLSLYENTYDSIRMMIYNNLPAFTYVGRASFDVIQIVLNPCLHPFHVATQEFLLRDRAELREWMERFIVKKGINSAFNRYGVYGSNRVRWGTHATPRMIPLLTSFIPNFNEVSVAYAACYVVPKVG